MGERGRHKCLTPLPTWSPTPTAPLLPSTLTLPPPPPTTTPPRPPMATTPSLVPPTCTLLVPLCMDARSARLSSPSTWSPATHTPLTSVSSVMSPLWLLPSLLIPTVPLCLLSPLMLSRPVPPTSLPLLRPEGRSVRHRCPSTWSPV